MLDMVRGMPAGVRLFVAYGAIILAVIGIALPGIVDEAVLTPVTGPGVVAMLLLAFTIFTLTLVLQRKRAAHALALGLSSLTLPLIAFLLLGGVPLAAAAAALLAAGLFAGLTRPDARAWFREE